MIVVIGGGASGMMASISASEMGKEVVLIEKTKRLGTKLSITGKGRCNITNACDRDEFFSNIPTNPKFLYSAFSTFSNYDAIDFFERNGVSTKIERGKRVFPKSDKATDVVNALTSKMKELGVKVIFDTAEEIITENKKVVGVKCRDRTYKCDSVLIATGGKSYPKTGSTGDGYELAKKVGHTVIKPKPSLVPLVTKEDVSSLMGLSLKNAAITLFDRSNKLCYQDFGEMLFTHFGLSGPVILSASSRLKDISGAKIVVDLKPALTEETLDERILRDFSEEKNKDFINSLDKLLPKKMIDYIVFRSGINPRKKVNEITKEERKNLVVLLKNLSFEIKDFLGLDEAIITSGGVDTKEINPKTMESKIIEGLYFSGEVIDIDAYTGGFNLQIAFSSGYVAGINM